MDNFTNILEEIVFLEELNEREINKEQQERLNFLAKQLEIDNNNYVSKVIRGN